MGMQGHIQKWGNSLGLRIPMQFAKQLKLHEGSFVVIEVDHDRLVIQPIKYDLDIMLKDINPKNQHHPILDDEQWGNEEW